MKTPTPFLLLLGATLLNASFVRGQNSPKVILEQQASIPSNSPNGHHIGPVHAGDTLTLQYVSGLWKDHPHMATENPDAKVPGYKGAESMVIAHAAKDGQPGEMIQVVPGETASTPFSYVFTADIDNVVLRIRSHSDRKENPGVVIYKVKLTSGNASQAPQPSAVPAVPPVAQTPSSAGNFPSVPASNAKPELDEATKQSIARAKAELAQVEATIASERKRWQDALATINRLTNYKRTPVQQGSQAYFICMQASNVINEVEKGASQLKADEKRLADEIERLSTGKPLAGTDKPKIATNEPKPDTKEKAEEPDPKDGPPATIIRSGISKLNDGWASYKFRRGNELVLTEGRWSAPAGTKVYPVKFDNVPVVIYYFLDGFNDWQIAMENMTTSFPCK